MTIHELSDRYNIEIKKLNYFADHHLIKTGKPYNDDDEKRLSIICTLYSVGLNADTIKRFLLLAKENNQAEQIKLLNKHRANLLEDVHTKQKLLDQVDYMIYEIKNKGGGAK